MYAAKPCRQPAAPFCHGSTGRQASTTQVAKIARINRLRVPVEHRAFIQCSFDQKVASSLRVVVATTTGSTGRASSDADTSTLFHKLWARNSTEHCDEPVVNVLCP